MRIAVDVQSTVGKPTGIGQYTMKLVAALRRVAPEHEYVEVAWGKDPVMRFHNRLLWQQVLFPRWAQRVQPDILHVPGFDAPWRKPCPTVLTCHDLIGMLFPRNLPPIARFYWSRWLPFSLRFADAIIADSEATRHDILRLTQMPPERITVTPLGVDKHFRPCTATEKADRLAQYALPERFLLYVGTLEPRKGIDTLITAFAYLALQYPEIHLVLGGKQGWYWESILQTIEQQRLQEKVHVTGYIAEGDLPALYAAAAVFVFPSRYEGFGLPILEAMACGTPVVCSNTSSLPEVAGDAALQVPPDAPQHLAAAITAILADRELAHDMQMKGLARAAQFTWDKTAERTLAVYLRLNGE